MLMLRWILMIVDTFREKKHWLYMQHLHYKSLGQRKKKHEVLPHGIKNNNNNNKKQVQLGTRIEAA